MRQSFIIHQVFHEEITSILPLIKIHPKKSIQSPAECPITVTQQTVLQHLMDLKISLHDSVLSSVSHILLSGETMARCHTKAQTSATHISGLGYCFVSRHVINKFQSCTDSRQCTVVHALQRAKSLGAGQLVFVLNPSEVSCFFQ